ncbi:MAG: hypothetical protein FJ125_01625, partial [Deltaproteobacteria bacterium]|nr:hypothetical protein [Deltaproteobacteria bacterium]
MKHDQRPASPMLQLALALALALVLTPAALSCGPDRSGGKPEEHDVRLDSGAASHDLAFAGDSRCEVGGDGATAADAAPAQDGAAADALPDGSSSGDGEEAGMNPSDGGTVEDTGDGGTAPPRCRAALGEESPGSRHLADGVHRATVEPGPLDQATCRRSYRLATDAPLRDGLPANPRTVEEAPELPALRTGHAWFDALYALALAEMREDSVDSIHDGAFDADRPIPCPEGGCFETGRLWTYIWTRDIAYSVQLGLAALDPVRARNSLEFKLSTRRRGDDLQIVQDTGSGGSYPVSSDRVVWALGAWTLLQYLDGPERAAFFERAYTAIAGTLAHDREVVFDEREGLYRGEQSFLDWREQSYPPWTAQDTVHIAMSRALSTNAGHLAALEIATALAGERGEEAARQRFAGQAAALRETMHRRFWLAGPRLLSSFATTFLDPAPVQRHDLLGTALAVLADVLPAEQAAEVVARYPVLPKGPPVIWPQQQRTPIYHNRAIWPFATAYWLRAARKVGNAAAVEHGVLSLMRGAALNLSHMESFELVSGAPLLQDGEHTGPVVNSQRQLWSVAGYVSMVHDVVFGLEAGPQGIRFAPFVTPGLRRALFPRAGTLVLDRFPYRGKKLDVVVRLPPAEQELEQEQAQEHGGAYPVGAVRLDGRAVAADGFLAAPDLPRHGLLE